MSHDSDPPDLLEIAVRLAVSMVAPAGARGAQRGIAEVAQTAASLAGLLVDEVARVERDRDARRCDGCEAQAVHRDVYPDPDPAERAEQRCCGNATCCTASVDGWKAQPLKDSE